MTVEFINIPEYWKNTQVRPRGFNELCDMIETQGKVTGIWMWEQWNPRTGEVVKREITRNVVTDNGAINILGSAIANASNANPWNQIYINNNSGSTQLTTALNTSTSYTSLAVNAIPAAIPLNYPAPIGSTVTQLTVGYGTGTTGVVTMSAAAAQNATSLSIVSFPTGANSWAIGANVVPIPNVGENPTNANLKANQSSVVEQYSGAIASGSFTYTPTTGAGNRLVQVTFTFKNSTNGGSTANGSYTDAWLVNVGSGATNTTTGIFVGNYIAHEINTPMTVNNSNNVTVTITIKI